MSEGPPPAVKSVRDCVWPQLCSRGCVRLSPPSARLRFPPLRAGPPPALLQRVHDVPARLSQPHHGRHGERHGPPGSAQHLHPGAPGRHQGAWKMSSARTRGQPCLAHHLCAEWTLPRSVRRHHADTSPRLRLPRQFSPADTCPGRGATRPWAWPQVGGVRRRLLLSFRTPCTTGAPRPRASS